MQKTINPAGQQSTEEYEAQLKASPDPILWPADGETIERFVKAAVVESLTQSLAGDDRRDKVIALTTKAVREAIGRLTRSDGSPRPADPENWDAVLDNVVSDG